MQVQRASVFGLADALAATYPWRPAGSPTLDFVAYPLTSVLPVSERTLNASHFLAAQARVLAPWAGKVMIALMGDMALDPSIADAALSLNGSYVIACWRARPVQCR